MDAVANGYLDSYNLQLNYQIRKELSKAYYAIELYQKARSACWNYYKNLYNNLIVSPERMKALSEVDLATIDKSELVDIDNVVINNDLSAQEKMIDYISQIKNPYCYLHNGITVKISFAGKKRLEECLKNALGLDDAKC